jgi:hypothetical protein
MATVQVVRSPSGSQRKALAKKGRFRKRKNRTLSRVQFAWNGLKLYGSLKNGVHLRNTLN